MNKPKDKRQHIKVFVRVRPINDIEKLKASPIVVDCPNLKEVVVNERPGDKITKKFTFDKVFGPESKQVDVYKYVANPLMKEVLDGYNCTIFAYGQTGTGKTYTMEGNRDGCSSTSWMNDSHAGIIPRALGHLFDELRLLAAEYSVKASYLEIYNEELIDLLSPVDDSSKIRLFEDATKKGAVIVNGLEELTVRSKEEIFAIMDRGSRKRQTASTLMNAVSSRSHTVFSITVRIKETGVEEGEEVLRTGKLNLVDLAGSENIGRSGAMDKRAREAGNINQSLLTLGRVITALVERTPHVPYRESKLTRLLQESLGGRTKTCIIATVSPSYCNIEETLSTLDYAHRAKNIQNKPEINQKIGKIALIKEYTEEIDRLKADLTAAREKSGVYLAEENYRSLMTQIQTQTREISELLQSNKSLTEVLEKKEELNCQLSESLQKYTQDLHDTKVLLKETKVDREKQIFLLQHRVETEKELSKQASTLLSVADIATSDVSLLHNTLYRKRSLEDKNLAVCKAFAEACQEKLALISANSSSFQEARNHSYESLIKELQSGFAVTNNHCKQTNLLVENALKSQSTVVEKMCAMNSDLATVIQRKVGTINEMSTEASNSDSSGLRECFSKILEQQQQMSQILSLIPKETQSMLENITAKIEQQERDLQAFFSLSNRHLREVVVGVNDIEKLICRLGGLVDGFEKWKENTKRKTAETFEMLQKNFYSTMNDFELEESSLRATVGEFDLCTMKSSLESVCNGVQSSEERFICQKEEINNYLNENFSKVSSSVCSIDLSCSEIHEITNREKSLVPERESERLNIIEEGLKDISQYVLNSNVCAQSSAQELISAQGELYESHKSSSESHLHQQSRLLETVERDIREEAACVHTYYSDLSKNVSECENLVAKLIEEEVKKDSPSGLTPQRRNYSYPRALVCTSPHERILSRFTPVAEEDDFQEATNGTISPTEDSNMDSSGSSNSSSLYHLEKSRSKSTSNINCPNKVCNYPCTSDPNIPYSILEKENTSPLKSVSCTRTDVKRQVLHDHNKT